MAAPVLTLEGLQVTATAVTAAVCAGAMGALPPQPMKGIAMAHVIATQKTDCVGEILNCMILEGGP